MCTEPGLQAPPTIPSMNAGENLARDLSNQQHYPGDGCPDSFAPEDIEAELQDIEHALGSLVSRKLLPTCNAGSPLSIMCLTVSFRLIRARE